MRLTKQDIDRLSALAQLDLTDSERQRFADELTQILELVGQLQRVDTTGVAPAGAVAPLVKRRPDQIQLTDAEALLANAPATEGGAVRSPRILP